MHLCGFEVGLEQPLFLMKAAPVEGGAGSIDFMSMDATLAEGPHVRRWQS